MSVLMSNYKRKYDVQLLFLVNIQDAMLSWLYQMSNSMKKCAPWS